MPPAQVGQVSDTTPANELQPPNARQTPSRAVSANRRLVKTAANLVPDTLAPLGAPHAPS
jgi:hypothetical protein